MGVSEIALLWQLTALQCCIRPSYRQSICWECTLMKVTISFTLMRSINELQGILQELRASDLSKVYGDCFTDLIYFSCVRMVALCMNQQFVYWYLASCWANLTSSMHAPKDSILHIIKILNKGSLETPWRSSLTSAGFADGQWMSGHFSTLDKIQSHICQACYHQNSGTKFQTRSSRQSCTQWPYNSWLAHFHAPKFSST